jgi:hypothetical protein
MLLLLEIFPYKQRAVMQEDLFKFSELALVHIKQLGLLFKKLKKVIMDTKTKKSKVQLLKELQDVVDRFQEKKRVVDDLLFDIEELEKQYHMLRVEIKNNN